MSLRQRLQVAEQAARLLLAGEARDVSSARLKALKQWPQLDREHHPDHADIEQALAQRRRLFQSPGSRNVLGRKRRAALEAMRALQDYTPRLSGPVLDGTAVDSSPVELHLFADRGEDVSMTLTDQGIPHDLRDLALLTRDGRRLRVPVYLFEAGEDAFELLVFPYEEQRRPAPLDPAAGRPMARADLAAVQRLLESVSAD